MPDRNDRPMVAFREVILDHLRKKQSGRCADCGHRIEQGYQERVVYKKEPTRENGVNADKLDNLKMIHFDCSRAHKIISKRKQQAEQLLDDGMSVRQVSIILKVSERTIQRYVKELRRRHRK